MNSDQSPPPPGTADVRVTAAIPEVARRVAQAIRHCFPSTEQCSYPAGHDGGTRLDITVDTSRVPTSSDRYRPWLRHESLEQNQSPPPQEGISSTSAAGQDLQPLPARLALTQPGGGVSRINGVWWPRSHDLAAELPALLMALGPKWGGITRITVDSAIWRPGPEQFQLADRTVHVTRSATKRRQQHQHSICLVSYGVGRCDLLVVPPETPEVQARRLMTAAGERDVFRSADVHRPAG